MNSRQETIDALRRQLSRPRQVVQDNDDTCPSLFAGIPGLKDLCVSGSTQRGLLIEWLSSGRGSGCDALAFLVAREALKRGGVLVVCDESGEFHARSPRQLDVLANSPQGPPSRVECQGQSRRIERAWGPERIESGWWRSQDVQRDYYRIETEHGEHWWVFRELGSGVWFLHGWF